MKIVAEPDVIVSVTPDNLPDFVGKPKVGFNFLAPPYPVLILETVR